MYKFWSGKRSQTRRAYLAGGASAAAALLAACASEPAAPAAKESGPVTVTYMSNLVNTHPAGNARLLLLDEFNKTNTQKITVDVRDGQAATGNDKIKALAAAGTPPSIFYVAYYNAAEFFTSGMTIDLEPELKPEKDWAKQKADIFPTMLESSMWAGKLVGMPGYTNNIAIVYNPALLTQAGVAPPKQGWTWDDFTVTAQKFVRPGQIALSMGWSMWLNWLGTTGARIITKDSRKITADTPEMQSVLELWLDFLKKGIIQTKPDGKSGLDETYQLAKNDTVFETQGSYRLPTFREKGAPPPLTIHVPVHPVKKQIFANNGGHSMIVFKEATPEQRHAAALVTKWMNSAHAQVKFCIQNFIPVSKGVAEEKELQDYMKTDPAFKPFIDLAPYGWRWPSLPSYDKLNKAIQDNVDAVMRQEIGVKAGLAKAQQEAQTLLDADVRLMQ
jgi:multiple sugar transport system substrate-binding protein